MSEPTKDADALLREFVRARKQLQATDRSSVQPFSNGSEYDHWQYRNCQRCAKYAEDDMVQTCPLDRALALAFMGTGRIPKEIADRLGCCANTLNYPAAQCPEFQPHGATNG